MLVVIDVQRSFAACEEVIHETIKEIRKARNNKEWIVLVEYDGKGHTANRILKEIRYYTKVVRMVKYIDDGSIAVFHAMRRHEIRPRHIKVCGINTSACVIKTVVGLASMNIPISVLSHACANKRVGRTKAEVNSKDFQRIAHSTHLQAMKRWKNVKVL